MNRKNALAGALVADAAAMGLHWMYDQEQIKTVEQSGDILFRQPDACVYQGKRGAFAHKVKQTGQLSHYGESARVIGQLTAKHKYTTKLHRQHFFESFGPCGYYSGYADKATKALVANIIVNGDDIDDISGMNDNQMPGVCVVSGLFSNGQSVDSVKTAAQVITTNTDVINSAVAVYECLSYIEQGKTLQQALSLSANTMQGNVGELMLKALAVEEYKPEVTAKQFGLACYIHHAMPVIWYILNNATDFESAIRDNIRCGGDSCGRSMALGAIAGLVYGVPEHLIERMENGRIPINY